MIRIRINKLQHPFELKNIFLSTRRIANVVGSDLSIKDIPHPTSLPVFGTKFNFWLTGRGTRLHEYVDRRHKKLGRIFHESLGGNKELIFISDPVLMKSLFLNLEGKHPAHILPEPWLLYEKLYGSKRGLLFMNGEEWLTNRRIMNKYLLKENAEQWMEIPVKRTVTKFVEQWKTKVEKQTFSPDLESEFYRLSTDVVINILLGAETSIKVTRHYEELITRFSDAVKKIFQTTTQMYGMPVYWFYRLDLKKWREFKESVDLSLLLGRKIISEILESKQKSNGLVKMLCDENIDHEMIKRISADFIIAAGDTSAYTTLWTLLMIANKDEIKEEIRTKGQNFVKNVIKESMRLYPVAPFLSRILLKESNLGPYKLEKNTPVIASIYTSGRDNQNFSRANEFLPFRWDRNDPRKQSLENHVQSASLPFAHGSRSCIGKKIAMLQLSEIITQIVENFDIKCVNSAVIKPITSQVLIPNKPVKLLVSMKK